jgi:hypothetical protein
MKQARLRQIQALFEQALRRDEASRQSFLTEA